jgi:hypothetical protein
MCQFLSLEDRVAFSLTSKKLRQKDQKFIKLSLEMNQKIKFLNQLEVEIACGIHLSCHNKTMPWRVTSVFLFLSVIGLISAGTTLAFQGDPFLGKVLISAGSLSSTLVLFSYLSELELKSLLQQEINTMQLLAKDAPRKNGV